MKKLSTVEDVVQRYFNEHVAYRVIDYKRPEFAWDKLRAHFRHIPISELNGSHVNAYTMKRKVSAGTINRELGVLSAALRWACLLYTSPSPRDRQKSRMPSSA